MRQRYAEPEPKELLLRDDATWTTPVLTCSALEGTGVQEVWSRLTAHRERLQASGELAARRRRQQVGWVWAMVREAVWHRFETHSGVRAQAVERILAAYCSPG